MKSVNIITLALMTPLLLSALPTSSELAMKVVQNWRSSMNTPLNSQLPFDVDSVKSYKNNDGQIIYHIVSMKPKGFVIVAGDDRVEPIIGFVPSGEYDEDINNPLFAILNDDLSSRVSYVQNKGISGASRSSSISSSVSTTDTKIENSKNKWAKLSSDNTQRRSSAIASVADLRVAPLLSTNWNQKGSSSGAGNSYNRYTPHNWYAGCVATAYAQILNYYKHDATLSTRESSYTVEESSGNVRHKATFLGGNGNGSAYDWSLMQNGNSITTEASAIAVGRLLFDAGIAVGMSYGAGGSTAANAGIQTSLLSKFYFSNAMTTGHTGTISPSVREQTINANLDAGFPVVLSITGNGGGHAIDCDGYGYDSQTQYHHLNMGWGGQANAWYNLPAMGNFDQILEVTYNIYKTGTGEVISGRVIDNNSQAISGVSITAQRQSGGTYTATTNDKGIYALTKIPSNSTYTVSATKNGYNFSTRTVQTKISKDRNYRAYYAAAVVGNLWGVNFGGSSTTYTNKTPKADAGGTRDVDNGSFITLLGSSQDIDGTIVKTEWFDGSTKISDLIYFDYYPKVAGAKTLTLKVTDNDGATHSDSMTLNIATSSYPLPTVDAGEDTTMQLGSSIDLVAVATSANGLYSTTGYMWKDSDEAIGFIKELKYKPTTAGVKTLSFRVVDKKEKVAIDTVTITVIDGSTPNTAPVANAGTDKTVELSHSITITGTASDSDGTVTRTIWKEGVQVISDTLEFDYTPTSTGTKVLTLRVTDDDGAVHSDSMTLSVTDDTPTPQTQKVIMSPILYLLQ